MTKVLVIDNYDSFAYNLVRYLEDLGCEVIVRRNDKITLKQVNVFHKILLSPGPGLPEEAGILKDIIKMYAPTKNIFGVCLGLQAIGEVFGAKLINLNRVFHGISTTTTVTVGNELLFKDLGNAIEVGRYHSWVVDANLPECLEMTAVDSNGQVMALRHKIYNVRGVQYHPESILTPKGKQMISNWLNEY